MLSDLNCTQIARRHAGEGDLPDGEQGREKQENIGVQALWGTQVHGVVRVQGGTGEPQRGQRHYQALQVFTRGA